MLGLPVAEFLALNHGTAYLGYSQRSSTAAEHPFFAGGPRSSSSNGSRGMLPPSPRASGGPVGAARAAAAAMMAGSDMEEEGEGADEGVPLICVEPTATFGEVRHLLGPRGCQGGHHLMGCRLYPETQIMRVVPVAAAALAPDVHGHAVSSQTCFVAQKARLRTGLSPLLPCRCSSCWWCATCTGCMCVIRGRSHVRWWASSRPQTSSRYGQREGAGESAADMCCGNGLLAHLHPFSPPCPSCPATGHCLLPHSCIAPALWAGLVPCMLPGPMSCCLPLFAADQVVDSLCQDEEAAVEAVDAAAAGGVPPSPSGIPRKRQCTQADHPAGEEA